MACSEVFLDTWETVRRQRDGTLSFTDAAIGTVARQREARGATFDVDFRNLDGISAIPDCPR